MGLEVMSVDIDGKKLDLKMMKTCLCTYIFLWYREHDRSQMKRSFIQW